MNDFTLQFLDFDIHIKLSCDVRSHAPLQGLAGTAATFVADTPTITMSRLKAVLTVGGVTSTAAAV